MTDTHDMAIEPAAVELAEREQRALHPVILAAMSGQISPDVLRDLLSVQREYEAGEAKKAYTRAMIACKRDLPFVIGRDRRVDFTSARGRVTYSHTSLAAAADALMPILASHGFSVSWVPSSDGNLVRVACRLTHREGHSEEVSLAAPPDTSGSKSSAQATMSAVTLLSRYTLLSLVGVATADMQDPAPPRDEGCPVIDHGRNLRALAEIRRRGRTLEDAEEICDGRHVTEWTATDLDKLRAWIRPAHPQPGQQDLVTDPPAAKGPVHPSEMDAPPPDPTEAELPWDEGEES